MAKDLKGMCPPCEIRHVITASGTATIGRSVSQACDQIYGLSSKCKQKSEESMLVQYTLILAMVFVTLMALSSKIPRVEEFELAFPEIITLLGVIAFIIVGFSEGLIKLGSISDSVLTSFAWAPGVWLAVGLIAIRVLIGHTSLTFQRRSTADVDRIATNFVSVAILANCLWYLFLHFHFDQ